MGARGKDPFARQSKGGPFPLIVHQSFLYGAWPVS